MGKANIYFDSANNRWVVRDKYGVDSLRIGINGVDLLRVGGGGTLGLITRLSGTIPGISAIGSGAVAVATITGQASAGIAVGDLIFGMPRAAIGGNTGIVAYIVPTTNLVNAHIANTKPDSAGSFVSVGVNLLQIRSA